MFRYEILLKRFCHNFVSARSKVCIVPRDEKIRFGGVGALQGGQ